MSSRMNGTGANASNVVNARVAFLDTPPQLRKRVFWRPEWAEINKFWCVGKDIAAKDGAVLPERCVLCNGPVSRPPKARCQRSKDTTARGAAPVWSTSSAVNRRPAAGVMRSVSK